MRLKRTTRSGRAINLFIVAVLAVAILVVMGLPGCGDEEPSRYLDSERRLDGMYEACHTIDLTDGQEQLEPISVDELDGLERVEVDAVLVRSNGMEMPGTWTGARLSDVLADRGVTTPFTELKIEAWDGYVGRVGYDIVMHPDTILAYLENGEEIPMEDGPVRLVVGSQDGFFWVRMLTGIEVLR